MNYTVDINKIVERLAQKNTALEIENAKLATLIEQFQADLMIAQEQLRKEQPNESE